MKRSEKREGEKQIKKAIVSGLIAVFVMSLVVGLLVSSVSATWCDANYGKKAAIHINNTAGSAQSDYQVMLNYSYDSDMNTNFSDTRIYNESDCSLIPLWNESAVASTWNQIWFNATNIPASSWCNDTYYLYYNYSSASTVSNIAATFIFGDDFETSPASWTKDPDNPIVVPGSGFESANTMDPMVVKNATDDVYHMFYIGWDGVAGGRAVGHATATTLDGTWTKDENNPILQHNDSAWDKYDILHVSILKNITTGEAEKVDDKYWMFYSAGNGTYRPIGFATATDLNGTWTKNYTYSPCLTPAGSGWEGNDIGSQGFVVVKDGSTYKMLYEGYNTTGPVVQIGLATSTNLTHWTKEATNPVLTGTESWETSGSNSYVTYPDLWKDGSNYIVPYCGYGGSLEALGLATGADLTSLTKNSDNPIAEAGSGWEAGGISDFSMFRTATKDYVFYEGETGGTHQIGLMWCDDILGDWGTGDWTTESGTVTYSSNDYAFGGSQSMKLHSGLSSITHTNITHSEDISISVRNFVPGAGVTRFINQIGDGTKHQNVCVKDDVDIEYDDGSWHDTGHNINYTAWYKLEFQDYNWTAYTFDILFNGTLIQNDAGMISGVSSTDKIRIAGNSANTVHIYVDNVIVRKYASPEPTSQLGTEQTADGGGCTTPVITDLTNSTPGTTNVTITWSTNQSADNRVKYSKNADLSNELWGSWHNDTSSISIELTSLDSGTPYYYQATSYNGTNSSCSITEPVSSPYKNFTTQSTGGAYNITLLTGWNIIGWTDTTTRTANYTATDIGSNCTWLAEKNKTTGNYNTFNPAVPEVNNFDLERGWGYYAYLSAETLWERTA